MKIYSETGNLVFDSNKTAPRSVRPLKTKPYLGDPKDYKKFRQLDEVAGYNRYIEETKQAFALAKQSGMIESMYQNEGIKKIDELVKSFAGKKGDYTFGSIDAPRGTLENMGGLYSEARKKAYMKAADEGTEFDPNANYLTKGQYDKFVRDVIASKRADIGCQILLKIIN